MKKSVLVLSLAAFMFISCGEKKKEEVKKEVEVKVETVVDEVSKEVAPSDAVVELGKKLFSEKTCVTCHLPDTKVIGPSIKDINKIYDEKNADIVQFLKGTSPAIVDTDPGQVAIMKANLDGFVKNLSDDELKALDVYMKSIK